MLEVYQVAGVETSSELSLREQYAAPLLFSIVLLLIELLLIVIIERVQGIYISTTGSAHDHWPEIELYNALSSA